jgi:hypothetical protein
MGRLMSQIPNTDPGRVARVMDAKYRCIGVRDSHVWCMQTPCMQLQDAPQKMTASSIRV